jgi:hypothetical protein
MCYKISLKIKCKKSYYKYKEIDDTFMNLNLSQPL